MEDFNSKYTGEQVEALLDIVSQGGGGDNPIQSSDIYYTDFTADDVYLGHQGDDSNPIIVTQDLLNAINDNKVIIVPAGNTRSWYNMLYGKTDSEYSYRLAFIGASETIIYNMDARDLTNGYVVNLADESFLTEIAYAPVNVGVDANSVVRRDDTGSINVIFLRDSAGKLCGLPTGNASEETYGDYTLQDKLISGKNIKTVNGQTLLGSGDITISGGNTDPQYYVMTSYSFEDILNLNADGYTGWYSQNSGDFMNITNAFTQKIPVYIERNADDAYKSLIPVTGYAEDLLYLTITDGAITIYMECSINGDWEEVSWSIYSFSDVELQLSDKVGLDDLAKVASSGSYNDLSDKPTIPSAVTESTVSGWGFTKNTGTYSKPSGGIPKTDLASAVQASLGKADTALQSYTEQYKGTITGISANGTSVATSGVANIPAASTSAYGVTKLSSATNSTSTTLAATPSAVKAAYDLANSYKGTVTGVKINGTTKNPSSGIVDLGTVITAHQTLKTINGQSIIGSGDITIDAGESSSSAYVTSFTMDDLWEAITTLRENPEEPVIIQVNGRELFEAINARRPVLIPRADYVGGYAQVIAAYIGQEDTSYLTIVDFDNIVNIECSSNALLQGNEIILDYNYIVVDYPDIGISPNTIVKRDADGSIGVSAIWDDAGIVWATESSSDEIKGNADYIIPYKRFPQVLGGEEVDLEDLPPSNYYHTGGVLTSLTIRSLYALDMIDEYTIHFFAGEAMELVLPVDVLWANGEIPTIEGNTEYELSLTRYDNGGQNVIKAILVKFS